jgi:mevalonate kinase
MIKAKAPGKIIITGEHAVVYGNPALAMAIKLCAKTILRKHTANKVLLFLRNLRYQEEFSFDELMKVKSDIDIRYAQFTKNEVNIKRVLRHPKDLLLYILAYSTEAFGIELQEGINIEIKSEIPGGCGMGSSAAIIISMLKALVFFFKVKISPEKLWEMGRAIENLQHGKSSGLDIYVALHKGCVFFENGKFYKRDVTNIPFVLINTGKPSSTTGLCVSEAAKHFKSGDLLEKFAAVARAIDEAAQKNDLVSLKTYIRENHRLLMQIGVVPNKVANFIASLEKRNIAAKVSGAGAVTGDNAGVVLVVGEGDIADLVFEHGYKFL